MYRVNVSTDSATHFRVHQLSFVILPQMVAQCKELQHTASQQEEVIRAVQRERDIAITTLGKHGLAEEFQAAYKESQAGSHVTDLRDHVIQSLRGQNEELRGVIRQMRQEMEELTRGLEHQHEEEREGERGKAVTSGYVKYMENEVMQVKSENRQLRERIQELSVSSSCCIESQGYFKLDMN